jgi:hypothetical protein
MDALDRLHHTTEEIPMFTISIARTTLKMAVATALVGLTLAPQTASAHQVTQRFHQPEQRAGNRITVEESWINVLACNGAGENRGNFYVYQYVKRAGFRAILPPHWASPLGGHDWGTFEQAAAAACHHR